MSVSTDNLTSVFTMFRSRLRDVAAAIVGGERADDVMQDAFCRLWAQHRRVHDETEAMKLSYAAVRNAAIDTFRRSRSHPTMSLETTLPTSDVADSSPSEDRQEVYEAVLKLAGDVLSPRAYLIFRLHDIEGLGYDEVAARMSSTEANIRVSLSRSRKTIREIYRRNSKDF